MKPKKQPKKLSPWTKAGLALFVIGIFITFINVFGVWYRQHSTAEPKPLSQVLNSNKPVDNGEVLISGTPLQIAVPSVNIDLKVIPGYYYPKTKSWTLSNSNAQYGVMTAKANNKSGATFIYAHALDHVFGSLPKIKPGDQAIITTDNGHIFTYSFMSSTITSPSDTSLFTYRGKPVLILQTCTGAWYQDRQLFVFNLSGVK